MKKLVFIILFYFLGIVASANPLFFNGVQILRLDFDRERALFYDKDNRLLGSEDIGEGGYVYDTNHAIGTFKSAGTDDDTFYYDADGTVLGKATEQDDGIVFYDNKNRMIAKYLFSSYSTDGLILTCKLSGSIQIYKD